MGRQNIQPVEKLVEDCVEGSNLECVVCVVGVSFVVDSLSPGNRISGSSNSSKTGGQVVATGELMPHKISLRSSSDSRSIAQ
jgi:hypothetical protein